MINKYITTLVNEAISNNYISKEDKYYSINRILALLDLNDFSEEKSNEDVFESIQGLVEFAVSKNLCNDDTTSKDIFEAQLTDCLISSPSGIQSRFDSFEDKNESLDWMFGMCSFTNYIKTKRIAQNTSFNGTVDKIYYEITINKSKPEKTLAEIEAAAKAKTSSNYPETVLSKQNVGYKGNFQKQPRTNHRVIARNYAGKDWHFQYSPYQYFSHHSILLTNQIEPMNIDENTYKTHMSFVNEFNSFAICSNADLPIVGGSILNHSHYQMGRAIFPIEKADKELLKEDKDVKVYLSSWKASTIVLVSDSEENIISKASEITKNWKTFKSNSPLLKNENNNTVSILTRKVDGIYTSYLVLRNNSTSNERPDGIYHVPKHLQAIKQENIGIIEAIGIAILPGRLEEQLKDVENQNDEKWSLWKEWISSKTDIKSKNFVQDALLITFNAIIEEVGVFNKDQTIKEEFLSKI